MFFLNKNKKKAPKWFKWGMLGFIAFAVLNGIFSEPTDLQKQRADWVQKQAAHANQSPYNATEVPSLSEFPAIQKAVNVDRWKRVLNPAKLREVITRDASQGTGDTALCGQEVAITLSGTHPDGTALEQTYSKDAPLTFRLGDGSQPIAVEETVQGMKQNGTRGSSAPVQLMFSEQEPTLDSVKLEVELLSLTPNVAEGTIAFTRKLEAREQAKESLPARCGSEVKAELSIADAAGNYTQAIPLNFTLGDPSMPHGLTRALLNSTPGDVVSATLPPAYANMPEPRPEWAKRFDGAQIVIVRLTRIE